MNLLLYLVLCFVVFCVTFGLMAFRDRIVIKFKVNTVEWLFPVIISYAYISLAIFFEILVNDRVQTIPGNTIVCMLIKRVVEGGILVPIIAFLFSYILGKLIETHNLDLNLIYGETIPKIIITAGILVNCVCILNYFIGNYSLDDSDVDMIVTRVVVWLIAAIGIWLPVGVGCQGRINAYRKNVYNSRKHNDCRMSIKYYAKILMSVLLIAAAYIWWFGRIDTFNMYGDYIGICILVCVVGFFGAFLVAIIVLRPSTSISEKHLARKISKASDRKAVGRYENIKYNICKIDKQLIIAIQAKEVIYSGHESELKDLFGEKKKIFEEEKAYDQIRQYLSDVAQSRREYIREAFVECKKEAIHDLERKSI